AWVGVFSAQMSGEPHDWSTEEVALLESVAERMWLTLENARLRQSEQTALIRQRRFLREVLFSLTAGKLTLCDTEADLPAPLTPMSEEIELSRSELRSLRVEVESVAETIRLPKERLHDLLTGTGEGAMNAVVHGGGGTGRIFADRERGIIQVWMRDTGSGISEEALPRALEKGASTAGTLGHGFWMILHTCDRVWLLTGAGGTTIVLEQDRTSPEPEWLRDVDLGV
ncbi:MAG: ATP-binding protein, partial [Fibrella sp.]|nr:ATP-binding protein [Armatimonadota bacterium]